MLVDPFRTVRTAPAGAPLFVGICGMQPSRKEPRFEWGGALTPLPAGVLLVRDPAQFWYLRGLGDRSPDVARAAVVLRAEIARHGPRPVVCVGGSSGGFGALLFGALLGAAEVHAFSPLTVIPSRNLLEVALSTRADNWRLVGKHIQVRLDRATGRAYRDLRPILAADNGRTRYHIYYGRDHAVDRRNAGRLGDLPRVTLHPHDTHRHDLVGQMRDSGELAALLAAAHDRVAAAPSCAT